MELEFLKAVLFSVLAVGSITVVAALMRSNEAPDWDAYAKRVRRS